MINRLPSLKMITLLIFIFMLCGQAMSSDRVYTFGVVPQQAASKLAKTWGPMMQYIEKKTGIKVHFTTAPNIPEFEARVAKGQYDFAYMNPYHYVVFSKTPGYQAINRASDKQIRGIMVKRKDSDINSLADLQDKTLAFPSPAAFAASILPRAELKKQQINITPQYVRSHDSVYRNVAKGIFPAGGGVQRTFNAFDPELLDELEVFWVSEGFTPHAIAFHPRVDSDLVSAVQEALVSLENSGEGRQLLAPLKIKGWQKAENSDWDDVRALNIQTLDSPVK